MDRVAFEQQARTWRHKALSVSMSYGAGRDEAEDIAQDVMLRLWQMHDELERYDSIEALTTLMARHLLINHQRRRKPEVLDETKIVSITTSPHEQLEMKEDERYDLENLFKAVLPTGKDYFVTGDNLGADAAPILITQSEFMRRYREMSAMGGGMNFYGEMPESYNITVNMENPLVAKIWAAKQAEVAPQGELPAEAPSDASDAEKDAARKAHRADVEAFAAGNEILHQITDLALLANGMLKGKALSDFIARSQKVVTDAYLK